VDGSDRNTDDLVMVILVGACLVGFVLGAVFLSEPVSVDRFTELYFVTHKVPLQPYQGPRDFNFSGIVVAGKLFGHEFWVLDPDGSQEVLVLDLDGEESRFNIYQTLKLGETYLVFADATSKECLFYEYPREVMEFTSVRLRFTIENRMGRDHTYYYKTYLAGKAMDQGQVHVASGEKKDVISSFAVGTTNNKWTRISVTLDTGQNISFGFRTYQ